MSLLSNGRLHHSCPTQCYLDEHGLLAADVLVVWERTLSRWALKIRSATFRIRSLTRRDLSAGLEQSVLERRDIALFRNNHLVEILEAGRFFATAAHPISAAYPYWDGLKDWPQESGGRAALEQIIRRCQTMKERTSLSERTVRLECGRVDEVLYELLAPERQRQKTEIVKAVDRVCELTKQQRTPARD